MFTNCSPSAFQMKASILKADILAECYECMEAEQKIGSLCKERFYLMPLTLLSQRVLLRDFCLDDWPAVHSYAVRPEVYRFQPWEPSTPDEARKFVEVSIAEAQTQPRTNYSLAIILMTTDQVIGSCNLKIHSQQFQHGELGYFLHPDYWNQGYATEVTRCLLRFGFTNCALHRIVGMCDPRNTASARVLEKVGMQYEGRLREIMFIQDGWRDSLLYSILKHEWQPLP